MASSTDSPTPPEENASSAVTEQSVKVADSRKSCLTSQ